MTDRRTSTRRKIDGLSLPEALATRFGAKSTLARQGVAALYDSCRSAPPMTLDARGALFFMQAERFTAKQARPIIKLARRFGLAIADNDVNRMLSALQTYYVLLVNLVAAEILKDRHYDLWSGIHSAFRPDFSTGGGNALIDAIKDALYVLKLGAEKVACGPLDIFKQLYEDLFPRALRHHCGEYYTPDWLAEHVLDQIGYAGEPGVRLLDPACGSGTFLLAALRRWRKNIVANRRSSVYHPSFTIHCFPIVGFDLNPLAVLTARANYLIALSDILPEEGCFEPPVFVCDSIHGAPTTEQAVEPFDYVVGNPPWITWDNLPAVEREASKPLWQRYGFFSLGGNEARHGGAKKDLSMLMLYAVADRWLKNDGRLGMVLAQSLLQTKGAGEGFRRFRLGDDGPPLGVLRVDDLSAMQVFDAAARSSVVILTKGSETRFPVPYFKWRQVARLSDCGLDVCIAPPCRIEPCSAAPVDPAHPSSPWLILSSESRISKSPNFQISKSAYTARLGANSGGANGVYWLELLDRDENCIRVRNSAGRGKHHIPIVEQAIEPDLIFPLLRWSDVRRWSAAPRGHILLTQDLATRCGIEPAEMQQRYPRTLVYLEQFKDLLVSRVAYRRYQQHGPFYSMYNVGPYTVAEIKVVWRRMDRRLNAAVVEPFDDPLLGCKPVVPQETCVLVSCDSADEAHYICALLNSGAVGELVAAFSVGGGKGFGTPGMLQFVPLLRFDAKNPHHLELAALSRKAHLAADENIQRSIDRLAARVLG